MGSKDTGASDGSTVAAAELRAVVHHEDGSYWAEVPDCPGLFASGDSLDELVDALAEAWGIWHDDADLPLQVVRTKLVPEVNELRVRIPVGA